MTLALRDLMTEVLFLSGIFALLFIAIQSSSEELEGLRLKAHPIPALEAQQQLSLPYSAAPELSVHLP